MEVIRDQGDTITISVASTTTHEAILTGNHTHARVTIFAMADFAAETVQSARYIYVQGKHSKTLVNYIQKSTIKVALSNKYKKQRTKLLKN